MVAIQTFTPEAKFRGFFESHLWFGSRCTLVKVKPCLVLQVIANSNPSLPLKDIQKIRIAANHYLLCEFIVK